MENKFIYFDNNATTPMDERVLQAMLPYFKDLYGNASSQYHFGKQAEQVVKQAKENVASLIEAESNEIYFTAGATESINLALKGLALKPGNKKRHIITCSTEHKAVLDTCEYLESIGFTIDYLSVNSAGIINLIQLESLITDNTLMLCFMWVNNETGVLHPVIEIGQIAKKYDVHFVCDATQGIGKLPFSVKECNADIVCFSAHKFYGPKGIGAIYINKMITKKREIVPLIHGGGQENGLRSGTYNLPSIVGFGEACKIAKLEMLSNKDKIQNMMMELQKGLSEFKGTVHNGGNAPRIYNTINYSIDDFDTAVFTGINKHIAISNGSACTSALIEPSYVLKAMGLKNDQALNSMRISLGKDTTLTEIQLFLNTLEDFLK